MNHKKLNLLANSCFTLILASGLLYTVLLTIASIKIFPGFVMQIIFLFDAVKAKSDIYTLIISRTFLVNSSFGLIWTFLFFKYLKAVINVLRSISKTNIFLNSLKIKKITPRYISYYLPDNLIFTVGFFKPKIYIAASLFRSHASGEIEAMLLHEENHQRNRDPLKIFIIGFIDSALPVFPCKNWLINHYLTLTEVVSDQFSYSVLQNKRPLISALFKLQQSFFSLPSSVAVNYFNSQSERIRILTGREKQSFKSPLIFHSIVLATILIGILVAKNTTVFFQCRHLLSCFKALVASTDQSVLLTHHDCDPPPILIVNHCQFLDNKYR